MNGSPNWSDGIVYSAILVEEHGEEVVAFMLTVVSPRLDELQVMLQDCQEVFLCQPWISGEQHRTET